MEEKINEECFLLLGEAPTEEAAARIAEVFSACPYVYFMGAFGEMVVGIYFLSGEHRWWLAAVAENPQATLGLSRAALYVTKRPAFPAGMAPRISDRGDRSPCGAHCPECPRYRDPCRGCPASRHSPG
ncbi:MAG: hypothetical protein XD60_0799 [Acetothermia bacterium 64_32]|nr:MAG: hypothetical protein XD60_0799 [Acetothermia bacterium 64_32]MBC7098032.1 hypothetical protein [Candidatus Bipolaricaulota bacterium]HAF70181.1 hypothetical protein [Candidatus Acetothermia bacterium]